MFPCPLLLQGVCPLTVLGCLHGGRRWDFIRVQWWCHCYNQHEWWGSAPHSPSWTLRWVQSAPHLTGFSPEFQKDVVKGKNQFLAFSLHTCWIVLCLWKKGIIVTIVLLNVCIVDFPELFWNQTFFSFFDFFFLTFIPPSTGYNQLVSTGL